MIISVDELKELIDVNGYSDAKLERVLEALEMTIRKYTNNHFHDKRVRFVMNVVDGNLVGDFHHISVGDTIEISASEYNEGRVVSVTEIDGDTLVLSKPLEEDDAVEITKVRYPSDVVQGVVNLMDWECSNREKVGIQSETISRHSVTYFNMDGNQKSGYPASLMDFLKPYCKARF